jgi:hypothetical protein
MGSEDTQLRPGAPGMGKSGLLRGMDRPGFDFARHFSLCGV